MSGYEILGGNGNDCSGIKRGEWSPEDSDGFAACERQPESGVTAGETATLFSLGYEPIPRQRVRKSLEASFGSLSAPPQPVGERGQREPHRQAPVTAGETAQNPVAKARDEAEVVGVDRAVIRKGDGATKAERVSRETQLRFCGGERRSIQRIARPCALGGDVTGVERHAPNSNPRLVPNPQTQSRLSNGQREFKTQAHAGPRDQALLAKVQQPSKRWRNIWRVTTGVSLYVYPNGLEPWQIIDACQFYGCKIHPSYEVAEQCALEYSAISFGVVWIDAVPVDGDK